MFQRKGLIYDRHGKQLRIEEKIFKTCLLNNSQMKMDYHALLFAILYKEKKKHFHKLTENKIVDRSSRKFY